MEDEASPSLERPVTVQVDGHVAFITFDRPQARNALSRALVHAGQAALRSLEDNDEVRCLVLTGAGDKAFCSGADLKERLQMSLPETRVFLDDLNAFCNALAAFRAPTIAALNGVAFGGGLELALACDLRLAADTAVMGLPEVKLGIIPGAGGTQRLARVCGVGLAKALVLTGRKIDAGEALRVGLVSAVVPAAGLRDEACAWAREIVAAGPLAVAQAKRAIDEGFALPLDEALAVERACYERLLGSADREEGLLAFAEKRPPRFSGR
ncbi:MAG: enoyl-CoA hydratase/isomerase family protein [Myxococcales bacterium]|nr:enoyl-CoA hydratase/isomerase family protein [Myxococcales bacterium]